jgi:hypothetical protein
MTPNASAIFTNRPGVGPSGSGAGFFTPVQQHGESSSNMFAAPPPVIRPNQYQLGVLPKATPESLTPSISHGTMYGLFHCGINCPDLGSTAMNSSLLR